MKRVLRALIRFYQQFISPLFPPTCRFYPTCSNYALEAIEVHGALKGVVFLKENIKENISLPGSYSYNGIDLVKLICSFLVCVVHVPPFAESFSAGDEKNC